MDNARRVSLGNVQLSANVFEDRDRDGVED